MTTNLTHDLGIEAVQFQNEWGPWHAVLAAGDDTVCGLNAIKARRMYERWSAIATGERCKKCAARLRLRSVEEDHTTPKES